MDFDVSFYVVHKEAPNNPESQIWAAKVRKAGFDEISDVSVGKVITFMLSASSQEAAHEQIVKMGEKLLINPVYEKFSVAVQEITDVVSPTKPHGGMIPTVADLGRKADDVGPNPYL